MGRRCSAVNTFSKRQTKLNNRHCYLHDCYCITLVSVSQFGLTSVDVGFVFIISGGTYALIAPFIGYICDIGLNPKKVMIGGAALTIVSYSIVGPAPFMPLQKYAPTDVIIFTTPLLHTSSPTPP